MNHPLNTNYIKTTIESISGNPLGREAEEYHKGYLIKYFPKGVPNFEDSDFCERTYMDAYGRALNAIAIDFFGKPSVISDKDTLDYWEAFEEALTDAIGEFG